MQIFGGDADVGELAEAGIHAVGGFIAGDDALNYGLRCKDSLPRRGRDGCVHRAGTDLVDLLEGQWLPV